MPKNNFRAFMAIDLPAEVKRGIATWVKQCAANNCWPSSAIKWVKPKNLHLTLCFLGNITKEQYLAIDKRVRGSIKAFPAVAFTLSTYEVFPAKRKPQVLILRPEPQEAIKRIAKTLSQEVVKCGILPDQRVFKPHITLGYINSKGSVIRLCRAQCFPKMKAITLKVTSIKLFKSEASLGGSIYTPLASYKFVRHCPSF